MSWNPNQGQDPNQPGQYDQQGGYQSGGYQQQGGYPQGGYQQQGSYQQQGGYPQGGYQQQGSYQQGGYPQNPYQQGGYQQPYGVPFTARPNPNGPTSMGMDANIAAGLSYVVGWVTGLIFFFLEKRNRFVRFHAMQSIIFFGSITILGTIFRFAWAAFPFPLDTAFACLSGLVGLAGFVGWIILLINGFQGKYFKLPVIGDYAEKYSAPTM